MAHHIETEALTKFYGRQRGIEQLTLGVGPGEVFGFLGPNGASKTTTIRLLMDLIRPTSGTIRVLGYDLRRDPVRDPFHLTEHVRGEEHRPARAGHLPDQRVEFALDQRVEPA